MSEYHIAGKRIARDFTVKTDEPSERCGTNQIANPQEHLLAALNACMIVGYTAACSMQGIKLDGLRIGNRDAPTAGNQFTGFPWPMTRRAQPRSLTPRP